MPSGVLGRRIAREKAEGIKLPENILIPTKPAVDSPRSVIYSSAFQEICFLEWYKAGRPIGQRLAHCIPVDDENGRKPNPTLIEKWRKEQGWEERADVLDAEVSREVERTAVEDRVRMLQVHAQTGQEMLQVGSAYLAEHAPDKMADAIKLIIEGARLQQTSVGLASAIDKVSKMTNRQLDGVVAGLLDRYHSNKDEKPELENTEDIVEGEFSESGDGGQNQATP